MAEMTEELLRQILQEAQEKGKLGLIIWANWPIWDEIAFEMKQGNEIYDFALSQIEKQEEATVCSSCNGFSMPGFIATSIQKLLSSNDFFKKTLDFCERNHFSGPISLVPITEPDDLS